MEALDTFHGWLNVKLHYSFASTIGWRYADLFAFSMPPGLVDALTKHFGDYSRLVHHYHSHFHTPLTPQS